MYKFILGIFALALVACGGKTSDVKEAARSAVEETTNVLSDVESAADVFDGPTTTIQFEEMEYNYGNVVSGEKVTHTFTFTNSGNEPLTLKDVKASCGCTTPSWSKEPIPPGGEGEIVAEFNTAGKSGNQLKTITVVANTNPSTITLKLNGTVEKEKKTDS